MSVAIAAAALLAGCTDPGTPGTPGTLLLARTEDQLVELQLPAHSRGALPPPSHRVAVGPFEVADGEGNPVRYRAPLPFAHIVAGHTNRNPPTGMVLHQEREPRLVWNQQAAPHTWRIAPGRLEIRLPEAVSPPPLRISYAPATAEEASLHLDTAGLSERAFALRAVRVGPARLHGVYLPAPAAAAWDVVLPARATLATRVGLLVPPVDRGDHSDGAVFRVEVEVDGAIVASSELALSRPGQLSPFRIDLSDWADRPARVWLRSEPGAGAAWDHVFAAEPALYTPSATPRRLVLAFVDTLRPDHLGFYGHDRAVSPTLDAWADGAVVFDNARSVAPWTLPAARSVLTGRQPEDWDEAKRLPDLLAAQGWSTMALISNAFLSEEFGMGEGWSGYRYKYLAPAGHQVDRALEVFEHHADRDVALLIHFMEPHLPYREEKPFRTLWAGPDPAEIGSNFGIRQLLPVKGPELRERLTPYLLDRYDQNVRNVDAQLSRLLDAAGPEAIVVVYSDHGEEFWEHGGIEHGHALFDEVLRVPLAIRAPGLVPGRVSAPVSLLDMTPTLLDLLEIPIPDAVQGWSLVPAARDEPGATDALVQRPIGFGRTLRGSEAWGVVRGDEKWIFSRGKVTRYDLVADPEETSGKVTRLGPSPGSVARTLATSLGRDVVSALRVSGSDPEAKAWATRTGTITVTLPGGFSAAWSATSSPTTPVRLEGDVAVIGPPGGGGLAQETWLVPAARGAATKGLALKVTEGEQIWEDTFGGATPRGVLVQAGKGKARVTVRWDVVPLAGEARVPTSHPAREEELRALGYVE